MLMNPPSAISRHAGLAGTLARPFSRPLTLADSAPQGRRVSPSARHPRTHCRTSRGQSDRCQSGLPGKVVLGLGGLIFSLVAARAADPAPPPLAPGAAPAALAITRVECRQGCAALDFVSDAPGARHQLEESVDLRTWRTISVARFERAAGSALRASIVGLSEPTGFFRLTRSEPAATNPPVYVNLQIDGELEDSQGLRNLIAELERRHLGATVFVTADYANRNALYLADLYRRGFEIGLHGYYTGEQLLSMTYAEQKDLLSRAKLALEGCRPCGTYKPITAFRPQYFSQNEDTFRVLDELGFTSNSGFKLGQLYLPGHAWDAAPYPAPGHQFRAIPITTIAVGTQRVYLCDIACGQVLKWTAAQWRAALLEGLAQSLETRQPLVLLLHGYYSGDPTQSDYWQPFLDFLDAAQGQVTFVQCAELLTLLP